MPTAPYILPQEPAFRGSQGAIWFAEAPDGRLVAIKQAGPGKEARKALVNELALLRGLRDAGVSGVVPVLDETELDGRPCMVMPRYAKTLSDWLEQVVKAPRSDTLEDTLRKCAQVAFILADVHRHVADGAFVVHRDIKPENLFLDDNDDPVLGDFGGAMAVDGLKAVELALFGTPMWAPLDQILPGVAIPDPTWDTYALCVLLFAALTGKRPAYQADPREMLTEKGQELWQAARAAIEAPLSERSALSRQFARDRIGLRAEDVIQVTGRAALTTADRATLDEGLGRLANLARLDARSEAHLRRALWELLSRGLSPLSHPSPPNRYRDAEELGASLSALRSVVAPTQAPPPPPRPSAPLTPPLAPAREERPRSALPRSGGWALGAAVSLCLAGAAAAGWSYRQELQSLLQQLQPSALERVPVPGQPLVIDARELDADAWQACVQAGACPSDLPAGRDPALPQVGLSAAEAATWCSFRGGRLPTVAEWEALAGPAAYPWGEAPPTCQRAQGAGCGAMRPSGLAPLGVSEAGASDLAGNAWEWVIGPEGPLLIGGDFQSGPSQLGRNGRQQVPDAGRHPSAGARCAYPLSSSGPS